MANATLTFALYHDAEFVTRETVAADIVKIGTGSKSQLVLQDKQASRMHAVIEVEGPDALLLIDLGSDLGTRVNGQRVNKARLCVGDEIEIGATHILLEAIT